MSIKPVDMQVTVYNSNNVSKDSDTHGKEGALYQQQANNINQTVYNKMTKVNSKDNAKNGIIEKEKQGNKEEKNKKKRQNKFEERHIIDTKI